MDKNMTVGKVEFNTSPKEDAQHIYDDFLMRLKPLDPMDVDVAGENPYISDQTKVELARQAVMETASDFQSLFDDKPREHGGYVHMNGCNADRETKIGESEYCTCLDSELFQRVLDHADFAVFIHSKAAEQLRSELETVRQSRRRILNAYQEVKADYSLVLEVAMLQVELVKEQSDAEAG